MKAMTNKAADRSSAYPYLDTVRLSEVERRHACESLRQGELFADFVLRVVADVRAIVQFIETAAASLAKGMKATLAKPVKH